MKLKSLAIAVSLTLGGLIANAVPAKPGIHKLTQPDGSVVEASIIGDEYFHYYETTAGELLLRDDKGTLRPCVIASDGKLKAEGSIKGIATDNATRGKIMSAIAARNEAAMAKRVAPAEIKPSFPTTGTVTGLILLCEFQDVKFTDAATKEHYDLICNKPGYSTESTRGSVIDYFTEQSGGKFTPRFDVVAGITLPYDRAHYGMTNDVNNLFRDAALEADKLGLDFSKYDINNDGFVDFLFVVFAGHGQAQGGPYESVWPAMQYLEDYVFDYFDGLNLNVAACACELKGGSGTTLDGVGTICHEFSHCLGLADIYDTGHGSGHGMSHYDIMDIGTYNNDQISPSGYTAMDKYTVGWLEPRVLDSDAKDVVLRPFNESHDAVFLVNPENPNEYYTLENRQQRSWDEGIPGHGLVISYCHYEPKLWKRNTVNAAAAGYEHVRIVAADNVWAATTLNEATDPYPSLGNDTFSAVSLPAAKWNSTGKTVDWAINNIRESEDGTITFDFVADRAGIDGIAADNAQESVKVVGNDIIAPADATVYDLAGRLAGTRGLHPGVYIVKTAAGATKVVIK